MPTPWREPSAPGETTRTHHRTAEDGECALKIEEPAGVQRHSITPLARRQLAEKLKIPYAYFERMRTEEPELLDDNVNACIGGMWDVWHAREPDALFTFTVLTTFPNDVSGTVHDRMPVIVQPKDYQRWLDPECEDVADILAPLAVTSCKVGRGSTRESVRPCDDASCIAGTELLVDGGFAQV